jgi:hypothetical protein
MQVHARAVVVLAVAALFALPGAAAAGDGAFPDHWIAEPVDCSDTTEVSNLKSIECGSTVDGDAAELQYATAAPLEDPGEAANLGTTAFRELGLERTHEFPAYCRYRANVVFYIFNFFAQVANAMRANASDCAEYWINVPAVESNKKLCRANQAPLIRGPRIHAMCEAVVSVRTGWAEWVAADPTRTWYQAGVEFRKQMASVGFDVNQGDTWSLNEVSSLVRRGEGKARRNLLDFMRGLYEGQPGTADDVQGNVFVVGLSQATVPTTLYKENLKKWFADAEFWNEASKYVRFWGQEVYGDVRRTLVPGAPRARRAESVADYLQQVWMLADAGGDDIQAAKDFLQSRHYPLANAAWARGEQSGFGFTKVPVDTMKNFVAIQQYAMRHYLGSHPQGMAPTFGWAWHLSNELGLPAAEFRRQWEFDLLPTLASSISGTLGPGGASQMGACGEPGEHVWCEGEWEGAFFNTQWELLRSWG